MAQKVKYAATIFSIALLAAIIILLTVVLSPGDAPPYQ